MRPKLAEELKQAITLRNAGYTLSAIVDKTGISASTLHRHFKKLGIERGSLTVDTVEEAKRQLINDSSFIDGIKVSIAANSVDDLSLVRQIREALTLSVEELTNDATIPAVQKARSLAALSTSLKITQEIYRKALGVDRDNRYDLEELPSLVVSCMTDEEIEAVKNRLNDEVCY